MSEIVGSAEHYNKRRIVVHLLIPNGKRLPAVICLCCDTCSADSIVYRIGESQLRLYPLTVKIL